jgi:hypothetical protein
MNMLENVSSVMMSIIIDACQPTADRLMAEMRTAIQEKDQGKHWIHLKEVVDNQATVVVSTGYYGLQDRGRFEEVVAVQLPERAIFLPVPDWVRVQGDDPWSSPCGMWTLRREGIELFRKFKESFRNGLSNNNGIRIQL